MNWERVKHVGVVVVAIGSVWWTVRIFKAPGRNRALMVRQARVEMVKFSQEYNRRMLAKGVRQ